MQMAPFLYNTLIRTYSSAVRLASPFHTKARKLSQGHEKLREKIEEQVKNDQSPKVWFHCASLGEFEQGRPVMEAFRSAYPDYKIVLTFFSPSGYEVRKNYSGADFIFYLPFDTPPQVTGFLSAVKPQLAFFVKYEFWYNYLYQLHKNEIPVFLVSGIFRPGQLFFKKRGGFYRNMLSYFTHLFVQNQESVQLLNSIGVTNTTLAGDTRFDRVADVCRQPKEIPVAKKFKGDLPLLVAGSSWQPDLKVLAPLLLRYKGSLKCIVAPHEVDEAHLSEAEGLLDGLQIVRFSKADKANIADADVLLVDNVGMLSALYALGDYAYVGGSFGKGLHNILEAATFGMPVFFGNQRYRKFQEATDLIGRGGAFAVADASELQQQFRRLFEDRENYKKAAEISTGYVREHTGATGQIMEYVQNLLDQKHARKNH